MCPANNNIPWARKGHISMKMIIIIIIIQWTPVNRVTNGPKNSAVLTGDCIIEGFLQENVLYGRFAKITRLPYYQGSCKEGFHCNVNTYIHTYIHTYFIDFPHGGFSKTIIQLITYI